MRKISQKHYYKNGFIFNDYIPGCIPAHIVCHLIEPGINLFHAFASEIDAGKCNKCKREEYFPENGKTVVVFFPEADAVPVFINEYSKIILSSLRSMICVSVIYVRRNLAPTPA
ncbi:MAG: hypothetical protein LT105_14340, partial [Lentimicrobium sp.]|nr:hypothetical protein [Lentimicrobium sp.]